LILIIGNPALAGFFYIPIDSHQITFRFLAFLAVGFLTAKSEKRRKILIPYKQILNRVGFI